MHAARLVPPKLNYMSSSLVIWGVALSAGLGVLFLVLFFTAKPTAPLAAELLANSEPAASTRQRWSASVREAARLRGWRGSLSPLLFVAVSAWLMAALTARFLGFSGVVAYVVAALAILASLLAWSWWSNQRKAELFEEQLRSVLQIVPGLLKTGKTLTESLSVVVADTNEPYRSEMQALLSRVRAGSVQLTKGLHVLYEKYPSRGFRLFLAAVDASESAGGGSVGSTISQAHQIMVKEVHLRNEAKSMLASTKFEFYMFLGIIAVITTMLFRTFPPSIISQMFEAPWVFIVALNFGWMTTGVILGWRIIAKAGGRK